MSADSVLKKSTCNFEAPRTVAVMKAVNAETKPMDSIETCLHAIDRLAEHARELECELAAMTALQASTLTAQMTADKAFSEAQRSEAEAKSDQADAVRDAGFARQERDEARVYAEELKDILRRIQWSANGVCPCCLAWSKDAGGSNEHTPSCELGAALAKKTEGPCLRDGRPRAGLVEELEHAALMHRSDYPRGLEPIDPNPKWEGDALAALLLDAAEALKPRHRQGPSVRSDADYAIEHAGYLATAASRFMEACNGFHAALDAAEDADGADSAHEALNEARELYSERASALRGCVYEFEKRRDRAEQGHSPGPSQDAFNSLSRAHGEMFQIAASFRDTLCRVLDTAERRTKAGKPLEQDEIDAMSARLVTDTEKLYGPGRPVPPHASGPASFASEYRGIYGPSRG